MPINVTRRDKFRSLRKKYGVSQRKVALALGVSESQIRFIETGRVNPSVELLFKMSLFFNTPPEELLPDLAEKAKRELETCQHVF
jgi:putative transcriptional regulator